MREFLKEFQILKILLNISESNFLKNLDFSKEIFTVKVIKFELSHQNVSNISFNLYAFYVILVIQMFKLKSVN